MSINLSIFELEYLNSFPLLANAFIVVPPPPMTPVNNAPSVPNLTLLINSLSGSYSSSLANSVGPPNKSPKVPASSTSPTNTPSAKPPAVAPPINFAVFPFLFNSSAVFETFFNALPLAPVTLK